MLGRMTRRLPLAPSDLRGLARLAVEAATGAADLVEAVHHAVGHPLGAGPGGAGGRGIKGLVYGAIRGVARAVGGGVDAALAPFGAPAVRGSASPEQEALLAALNGVVGDHLAATGNPLALPMTLRHGGRDLDLDGDLAAALPAAGPRLLVLVHGLCRNDRQWDQDGHDHGAALARDQGWTPLYLRYNSGLHISENGRALADLLEALLARWPVPVARLAVLAHSMGGLVARSACRQGAAAGHAWPGRLGDLVFLGTPHHGAPLERGGHWLERALDLSPHTGPFARLARLRSAGITDLRFGNLLAEDWQGRDRFSHGKDTRVPVPLPEGVRCRALAGRAGKAPGSWKGRLLGDGLVPLDSALGRHRDPARCLAFPADSLWTGEGMDHLDLLARPEAYARIRAWLEADR